VEGARPAVQQDAERCAELCRGATDELQAKRGGPLALRGEVRLLTEALLSAGGLATLVAGADRRVLVGTVDDVVVGFAVGRVEEVGEKRLGVIEGCYVEPGARGVGVGRAMLDGLLVFFRSSGCDAVDATALPGDRGTKNFYEAAGFKARLLTLHHELS